MEKNPRPASKISSLIQEAESKAAKKKSSIENLNLMKRESPLGGEDNSSKSDDLSNAPKLPPKPGKKNYAKKNIYILLARFGSRFEFRIGYAILIITEYCMMPFKIFVRVGHETI